MSVVGELQFNDIVNSQNVGNERKRKRSQARIEQRSLTTSETEWADNSDLQNRTGLKNLCASGTQSNPTHRLESIGLVYHVSRLK